MARYQSNDFPSRLPKAFITDYDQALSSEREAILASLKEAIKQYVGDRIDVNVTDLGDYYDNHSRVSNIKKYFHALEPKTPEALAELKDIYREKYGQISRMYTYLLDGAEETLDYLNDRGIKVAIASNKPEDWLFKEIAAAGIAEKMDTMLGITDGRAKKPDPEILNIAADRLNVMPHEAWYFGDNYTDYEAAKKAGFAGAVMIRNDINAELIDRAVNDPDRTIPLAVVDDHAQFLGMLREIEAKQKDPMAALNELSQRVSNAASNMELARQAEHSR